MGFRININIKARRWGITFRDAAKYEPAMTQKEKTAMLKKLPALSNVKVISGDYVCVKIKNGSSKMLVSIGTSGTGNLDWIGYDSLTCDAIEVTMKIKSS